MILFVLRALNSIWLGALFVNLSYARPGKLETTRFEKNHFAIFQNSVEASRIVVPETAQLIKSKQTNNKTCVLGLTTGSSPIKVYDELVRLHIEEGLSFSNVVALNLEVYYPMKKKNNQSYNYFMHQQLFNHVDIKPENINIPDETVAIENLKQYCVDYENKIKKASGLDFQMLGIGRKGHGSFNEPVPILAPEQELSL